MSGLSHGAADAARPFRFVDGYTRFVLLPDVHATAIETRLVPPTEAPGLAKRDEAQNQERI
jgi:hypothetical protein